MRKLILRIQLQRAQGLCCVRLWPKLVNKTPTLRHCVQSVLGVGQLVS